MNRGQAEKSYDSADITDIPLLYKSYYSIAGVTIQLESEVPFSLTTFDKKFDQFRIDSPTADIITIRHIFSLSPPIIDDSWQLVYKKTPWAIYKGGNNWIYLGTLVNQPSEFWTVGVFTESHNRGVIYHTNGEQFSRGKNHSLTLFPTDQIILARILAERQACYIHAAGMILYGKGVLFVGHSEAGKSTTVTMLQEEGEILCDDRIVVRRWHDTFKIHGTWSHGDVPLVSNSSAPLHAIFILEKSQENSIEPVSDRREVIKMLPLYVIQPVITADWWEKILDLLQTLSEEVPVYRLKLDKSGKVKELLRDFLEDV